MTANVVIAVPVRDEASHIVGLLQALAGQQTAVSFDLFLLFDGGDDGGPELAAQRASSLPFDLWVSVIERLGMPNAGLARARACRDALAHDPDAILLTTDADSAPAADWIAASLRALTAAEIAAGRIEPDRNAPSPRQERLAAYLDRLHKLRRVLDPVSWEDARTHHWTSAASLAFRPGAYRNVGGFAPLPRGEDADLGDRAWRRGMRLRRDARIRVATSSRRGGRAIGGFAELLTALDTDDTASSVAHPDDEAWRYRHHAWARQCWRAGITDAFTHAVGIDRLELDRLAAASPNAEAFTASAVAMPPRGMRTVSLSSAEAALDALTDPSVVA